MDYIQYVQSAWTEHIRKFSKKRLSKAVKISIGIFLALLALLVVMRSCSGGVVWAKSYKIARDKTWYPLQLYEKERNFTAFSDELLIAISKQQHIEIELVQVGSDNLFLGLDNDQYDAVLSSLEPDAQNRTHYVFSNPYYLMGPVVIVKSSSKATSLADMEGKIVGIRTGSSVVFNIQQYPNILIKSYDNPLTALMDLDKNDLDAVILDALTATVYSSGLFKGKVKIITHPLTNIGLRLIAKNKLRGEHLIDFFNEGLKILKENGSYNQLILKWNLYNPELH